jgi:hypothetical protein
MAYADACHYAAAIFRRRRHWLPLDTPLLMAFSLRRSLCHVSAAAPPPPDAAAAAALSYCRHGVVYFDTPDFTLMPPLSLPDFAAAFLRRAATHMLYARMERCCRATRRLSAGDSGERSACAPRLCRTSRA